jgi:hypothetical protein
VIDLWPEHEGRVHDSHNAFIHTGNVYSVPYTVPGLHQQRGRDESPAVHMKIPYAFADGTGREILHWADALVILRIRAQF